MNEGQKYIMFLGHKQEEPTWEKVINVQNEVKFLNSPTAIVVQKEKRKKTKLSMISTSCLHMIHSNAGFVFYASSNNPKKSKEKDAHNDKTPF